MFLDNENLLADEQAVTVSAASEHSIDLGAARDIGTGENLYVVAVVTEAFADVGSDATVAVKLQTDSDSAFGSPTDAQELFTLPAVSPVGTAKFARLQPGAIDEQYLRGYFTVANGPLTAGKVKLFLTHAIDKFKAYADAVTIS